MLRPGGAVRDTAGAAFLDDVAAVMSAGPTSEGTLRFVKTYEVGMNTDSPNGPGPERLICRFPCRPAQTDRGGALRWSTPA